MHPSRLGAFGHLVTISAAEETKIIVDASLVFLGEQLAILTEFVRIGLGRFRHSLLFAFPFGIVGATGQGVVVRSGL